MKVEEDLLFWYHLYAALARPMAQNGEDHWSVKRTYQVDGDTIQLLCFSDDLDTGYVSMCFTVKDLYRLTFKVKNVHYALEQVVFENALDYALHCQTTPEEFEHHMTMLKLQVAA